MKLTAKHSRYPEISDTITIHVHDPYEVTALSVEETSIEMVMGETLEIPVVAESFGGEDYPVTPDMLTWKSSATTVVKVANGVLTPVKTGSATITVTAPSGLSTKISVKVLAAWKRIDTLECSQKDANEMTLTWSDCGTGVRYYVYADGEKVGDTTAHEYTVTGLELGDHTFGVQPYKKGTTVDKGIMKEVVASVEQYWKAVPSVNWIQTDDGTVMFMWEVDDERAENVLIFRAYEDHDELVAKVPVADGSKTVDGLGEGEYEFIFALEDDQGAGSNRSIGVNVTLIDMWKHAPEVTATQTGPGEVLLTWNDTGAESYSVFEIFDGDDYELWTQTSETQCTVKRQSVGEHHYAVRPMKGEDGGFDGLCSMTVYEVYELDEMEYNVRTFEEIPISGYGPSKMAALKVVGLNTPDEVQICSVAISAEDGHFFPDEWVVAYNSGELTASVFAVDANGKELASFGTVKVNASAPSGFFHDFTVASAKAVISGDDIEGDLQTVLTLMGNFPDGMLIVSKPIMGTLENSAKDYVSDYDFDGNTLTITLKGEVVTNGLNMVRMDLGGYGCEYTENVYITFDVTETTSNMAELYYKCGAGAKGWTVTGYTGNETEVIVPTEIYGLRVVEIGDGAFENNTTMSSIDLPDCITRIGKRAFAGCTSLKQMN